MDQKDIYPLILHTLILYVQVKTHLFVARRIGRTILRPGTRV